MGLTVLSTSVYLAHRAQLCCLQCCDLVRVAGHCVCGVLQPTTWFVLCIVLPLCKKHLALVYLLLLIHPYSTHTFGARTVLLYPCTLAGADHSGYYLSSTRIVLCNALVLALVPVFVITVLY